MAQEESVWEVEVRNASSGEPVCKWVDVKTNRQLLGGLDDISPPLGYRWTSNWKVVMDQLSSDPEGWRNDGPTTRKRLWTRKFERPSTSTISANSSSNKPLDLSSSSSSSDANVKDEPTMQKLVAERLKRLKAIATGMASVNIDRMTLDALSKESKERIQSANALISKLHQSERAIVRAAAIKLGNELLEISRKVDDEYTRALPRATLSNNANGSSGFGQAVDVALREAEEERLRQEEAFKRQQQSLMRMEQEHREIFRNEVDTTVQIIEERHVQIEEANRKAAQLNAMMAQVSQLVADQGEQTHALRVSVEKNRDVVDKGLAEIQKAEKYQQEAGSGCMIC